MIWAGFENDQVDNLAIGLLDLASPLPGGYYRPGEMITGRPRLQIHKIVAKLKTGK